MTVYPGELLTLFNGSATVSLVSHKPSIRDVEEYEDWVYVGRSVAMLLIAPRYKDRLFRKLRSLNYTIELAPYTRAFIKGNQVTLMSILVHCLKAIHCNAVTWEYLVPSKQHEKFNIFNDGTETSCVTSCVNIKAISPVEVTVTRESPSDRV